MAEYPMLNPTEGVRRCEDTLIQLETPTTRICKICFEGPFEQKPLITPCNCAGTVKYAHEDCLKQWLQAKNRSIEETVCEICHGKIGISYKIKKECLRGYACKEGQKQTAFAISLILLVCIFAGTICLVVSQYNKGIVSKFYAYSVSVISLLFILFLIVLSVYTFFKAFVKQTVTSWKIISRHGRVEVLSTI